MIKVTDYIRFYVECDTTLELELITCVIEAFQEGAKNKGAALCVSYADADSDVVEIEGNNNSKEVFEHTIKSLQKLLTSHNKTVAQNAIDEFKRRNNLPLNME